MEHQIMAEDLEWYFEFVKRSGYKRRERESLMIGDHVLLTGAHPGVWRIANMRHDVTENKIILAVENTQTHQTLEASEYVLTGGRQMTKIAPAPVPLPAPAIIGIGDYVRRSDIHDLCWWRVIAVNGCEMEIENHAGSRAQVDTNYLRKIGSERVNFLHQNI